MNSIQSLWTEVKTYLELQKEYLKLDSAEKLSVLLSAVATAAVCLILGLAALFFFVWRNCSSVRTKKRTTTNL